MKKAFIVGLIAAAIAATNAQAWTFWDTYDAMDPQLEKDPITFRGLEWGIGLDTVHDAVIKDGITEDNCTYNADTNILAASPYTVAGLKMAAVYMFDDNDDFYVASYIVMEKHPNDQQYYLEFLELQDKLTSIYGEITLNDDQWLNSYDKEDEEFYGLTVASERAELCRGWKASDGSAVILRMSGQDYVIVTQIFYISPDPHSGKSYEPDTDGL